MNRSFCFAFSLSGLASALVAAGCAGYQSPSGTVTPDGTRVLPAAVVQQLSLSMVHYVPLAVHSDRSASHMQPDALKKSALIYVGDWATNDVFVYDWSGKQLGTLTGFSEPYGMCVDAKGDIYIANFGAGNVVEYAHGGSSAINTYPSGGEPMGCAVDAKGDVAVTSFAPGEVVVFAGGDPSKGTLYTGPCTYQWTMGYDAKNDLIGVGEESTGTIAACALLAGSKSMTTLSGCCTGPITIDFPGGTTWDGKHIAIGDQEAGGTFLTGIWRAMLSGTVLSPRGGEIKFTDSCYSDYADVVNPFIIGKKNTPVNRRQGKVVVGPNLWCADASGNVWFDFWHYPSGIEFRQFTGNGPSEPYGGGVSLKP